MSMSDPLADMLTRIRNGIMAKFDSVTLPSSKQKVSVANVLKKEGYINDFRVTEDSKQGVLTVELKYAADGTSVITGIKRV